MFVGGAILIAQITGCATAEDSAAFGSGAASFTGLGGDAESGEDTGEEGVEATGESGEGGDSGGEMEPDPEPEPLPVCGDGQIDPGESCDDGDQQDQDGCDADCEPSAFVAVSAGRSHSCALNRVGQVWCWGSNAYGQLGHGVLDRLGDDEDPFEWGPVPLGERAVQLSAGALHTCALLEDQYTIKCWGSGAKGRLGNGSISTVGDDEFAWESAGFDFGEPIVELAAGRSHSCARTEGGQVHCWGGAEGGALGLPGFDDLGDDESASSAPAVELGSSALGLSVDEHSCVVVETDGLAELRCWGKNHAGELGMASSAPFFGDDETPASLETIKLGFASVVRAGAAGVDNSCAIVDEQIRCWGDGYWGVNGNAQEQDLGDDEHPYVAVPGVLIPGEYARAVDLGELNACALLESGRVRCWGEDATGLLGYELLTQDIGDDEYAHVAPAHRIGSIEDGGMAVSLSVGDRHACVLTAAGGVRCWGNNEDGQLGYGDTDMRGDQAGELSTLLDLELELP